MARRRLVTIVGLLLTVWLGQIVYAQDDEGLTDEQLAWIERVAAARETRESYASYVEISTANEKQSIEITLGTLNQTISDTKSSEYTATYVQGDTYNVHATITSRRERVDVRPNGQQEPMAYSVSAEVRVVDDAIYMNAVLGDGMGAPVLPGGWIRVDDVSQYADLNLDDLLDNNQVSALEDEDLMRAAAADVTLRAVTLDDGTPADVITVTFERAGLESILAVGDQPIDPMADSLLDAVGDNFSVRIAVTMDVENHPLQAEFAVVMDAEDVDAYALSPDQFPEGMVLDFHYEISETLIYRDANVRVEPVEAPADLLN